MSKAKRSTLRLANFLPYRLSVLSNRISDGIAVTYEERFGISVPEWRVMAILAEFPGISAREVSERTAMHKVAISRTLQKLLGSDRVVRKSDASDRRKSELSLSAKGRREYAKIIPLAIEYESSLLAALSAKQRRDLDKLLNKLADAQAAMEPLGPG